jgi:hypothetical protein
LVRNQPVYAHECQGLGKYGTQGNLGNQFWVSELPPSMRTRILLWFAQASVT